MNAPPSKDAQSCRLDPLPQNRMQAGTRHDVGRAAKDLARQLLHIHQLVNAQLASAVIEEEINIGVLARLITRRRSEEVKMLDTEKS